MARTQITENGSISAGGHRDRDTAARSWPWTGSTGSTGRDGAWRLSDRSIVLAVAGIAALVLGAVVALLPVPYVIFAPGPVRDTLGTTSAGDDLIVVDGTRTYPTDGELDLTTISVAGGPLGRISVVEAIGAYLDPSRSLRPVESVYPSGATREEAREASTAQMVAAQQSAAVAALLELGREVPADLVIAGFAGNPDAEEVLETGDVVRELDGTSLAGSGDLVDRLQSYEPGDTVTLRVTRGEADADADVTLAESPEGSVILGVLIAPEYELPFEVTYDVGGIGGPSAGLMFSLGIYDKLTPGALTGGERIAGTGTMADDGSVGPIDGIQQKLVGAREHGASWFLAPAANCSDVLGAVPDGISVTAVATLDEALAAVGSIADDEGTADLPTCEDVLEAA